MRNPTTVLYAAIAGVVIYLLWKAGSFVSSAVDSASQSFANWYVNFATPPVTPLGNAIFADGSYVPMAELAPNWVGNSLQFGYKGTTYSLASHDANGNYPATPVDTSTTAPVAVFSPSGP